MYRHVSSRIIMHHAILDGGLAQLSVKPLTSIVKHPTPCVFSAVINAMTHPPSIRQKAHRIGPFCRFAYQWHDDAVLAKYQRYRLFHEIVDSWFIQMIAWFMMKKLQAFHHWMILNLGPGWKTLEMCQSFSLPWKPSTVFTWLSEHFFQGAIWRSFMQFLQHQREFIYI